MKKAIEWIKRNVVLTILSGFAFFMLGFEKELLQTLYQIVILEVTALSLSALALWAYTNIDFIKGMTIGSDKVYDSTERSAYVHILGAIFLAVHILVGLASYSYFARL